MLHFHLDCPAARNCLSRTALLFIICRTWCCERSCQSLCSSGYKTIAEIRKALPLLAWPAPRHIAFSGVNMTNLLNQKSTFCLSGCSEMPSSEYGQGGSCSDGAVNKHVVLFVQSCKSIHTVVTAFILQVVIAQLPSFRACLAMQEYPSHFQHSSLGGERH